MSQDGSDQRTVSRTFNIPCRVLKVQASILYKSQTELKLITSAGRQFNDTKEEIK